MSVGLSLLAYAVLVCFLGPLLLSGRGTTRLVPRLGVLAWQAAALSAVGAGVIGGLALAVPAVPHGVNEFLAACTHAFPGGAATAGGAAAAGGAAVRMAGLAVAAAVLGRAAWGVGTSLVIGRRQRRRHADALRIVAQPSPRPGAVVLQSDVALVYCVPGRGGQVVVTSGALRSLSESELGAVLAHEGAHLRGRHHLALAVLRGLNRAFPGVPLFGQAVAEVGRLLEMCADDIAAIRHGRATLISALSRLSTTSAPAMSLAAAATAVEERVRRLSVPPAGRARPRTALTVCVVLLAAGPLIAAGVPFAADLAHHLLHCPPSA
ncbi:MAG: Peptidase M48, Ste24p precursor [uncultured Corynebacteriales bacterium]|uniref:Peptidase M48, Ste24p n=1 Tax=uncultured Mycobacteriales bacterium TaxID=581187 RepID=A0A6J4HNX9_9ACTN|nr:MAG: Peptidase M48, Ste24p precursor [uncultured Corynebacteriales bacterium]